MSAHGDGGPIRLLLLGEGDLSHGALLHRLAAGLRRRPGVEAIVDVVEQPSGAEALLVANVRPFGHLDLQPLRWRLRYSFRARQRLKLRAPGVDVAMVNTQSCALLSTDLMRRVPTVLSVDITGRQFATLDFWSRRTRAAAISERPLEALERRAFAGATRIVAWSEWTAQSLRDDYDVPPERLSTLHYGVDLPERPARRPEGAERPLQLLFVGNFSQRKGLDLLLTAVRMANRALEVHVVTKDRVEPQPGIHVHRGIDAGTPEFRERFRDAEAFVLPSRADAVPWVVVEAMAAGLPVIATPIGAIPELVGDAGLLVPVGDAAALADAVRTLADDRNLCRALGERARRRAEERYDAAVQIPRLLELLRACA